MARETLLDFFHDFANFPDEFLIYDDGYRSRSYSYAQVAAAARAFAARLHAAGIGPGDNVLVWSENRPEWVAALWGCLLAGAIAVPIDYRVSAEMVRRVQEIVRARVLLTGDEVTAPPPFEDWPLASLDWDDAPSPTHRAAKDDIAEIIFTSGATSDPKGVIISHTNVLANSVPVEREVLRYRPYGRPFFPIRFLNLLPLSHLFGQAMATFIPPMLPGVVVFMRGYNPQEIVRQIRTRRVSVLVSVPKILEVLREYVLGIVPEAGRPAHAGQAALVAALVALSPSAQAVRLEVLELHCGRGAARSGARGVLVGLGLSRYPGLRADRNRADRDAQPSVPCRERDGRKTDRRRGSPHRG
jgi:long-chain acyl-CoA synthetase